MSKRRREIIGKGALGTASFQHVPFAARGRSKLVKIVSTPPVNAARSTLGVASA